MDKIFVGWVKVKDVEANGKSWQYTQISFKAEDLEKMAQYKNDAGYINLKLNRSQAGKEYLEIDTFGVNQQQPQAAPPQAVAPTPVYIPTAEAPQAVAPPVMPELSQDPESDLPF